MKNLSTFSSTTVEMVGLANALVFVVCGDEFGSGSQLI